MEFENIVIHEEVVARVKEKMPQEEPIYEVSELFKVFASGRKVSIRMHLRTSASSILRQYWKKS